MKAEDLVAQQRLRLVLVSAYRYVPYYRQAMRRLGFDPCRHYRGPADLARLPITTKKQINRLGTAAFCRPNAEQSFCHRDRTSGSTGVPLETFHTHYELLIRWGKWYRMLLANGFSPGQRFMALSSPTRIRRARLLRWIGILPGREVNYFLPHEEIAQAFLDYRPQVLYGSRTNLELLAFELTKRAVRPRFVSLLASTSEPVPRRCRDFLREVFGTEPVDLYGSVEVGVMAHETSARDGLHLRSDLVYFEFLGPDGRPVQAGEPGRVVVTDLASTLMPLIRYDQGDLAIYEDRPHIDGATQRRIVSIVGRDNDFIEFADGTLRSAHDFTKICDGYHGVRQFRVLQRTMGSIKVLVAADPDCFAALCGDLADRLRRLLPPSVRAEIERVEFIPADAGGKARMLVSELGRRSWR